MLADTSHARAASAGDAIGFASLTAFADTRGTGIETEYISERAAVPGTPGWSTHGITPQQGPLAATGAVFSLGPLFDGEFSPDLSHAVYRAFGAFPSDVNVQNVPNLYMRDDLRAPGAGHYQLLTDSVTVQPPPSGFAITRRPMLAGASADFSHVIFESNLNLTPGASGGSTKLYEWHDGLVRPVGVGLDGTVAAGSVAGLGASISHHTPRTISSDGSRIFFTDPGTGNLYARIDGAVTTQMNASEKASPESPSTATYWSASTDGTRVFFTTTEGLVEGDANGDNDLYMWKKADSDETQGVAVDATSGTFTLSFDGQATSAIVFDAAADTVRTALEALSNIGSGNVAVTGGPGGGGAAPYVVRFIGSFGGANVSELSADASGLPVGASATVETTQPVQNLTLISRDTSGADAPVTRNLMGVSEDGRYVYFTASGELLAGAGSFDEFPDGAGMYLWHDGALRYIGWLLRLDDVDRNSPVLTWSTTVKNALTVRVTPDGRHLMFGSHTDVGLRGQGGFAGADHGTTCSFDPEAAGACRELYLYDADTGSLRCASCHIGGSATGDALTAHRSNSGGSLLTSHQSHALSDDGRYVFFATEDPLVPQDVNGKRDVYVYDAATETQHLLTSGTSSSDSYLMDASASGRDAFFLTRERLVGWDVDDNYDVYDARVGGGLPDPVTAPAECSDDACQAPPSAAPAVLGSASQLFRGTEDPAPRLRPRHGARRCRHGTHRVVRRGKATCVRKHKRPQVRSRRAK
ncbi:MAG TPA: hypothetical protein VGO48_10405 [Conexibacter sp.]|nr:hypothetical protein [Conexibacter sp.]